MTITVKGLIEQLQAMNDPEAIVCFGDYDSLTYHQVTHRDICVQIEFAEHIYRDRSGKLVVSERTSFESERNE